MNTTTHAIPTGWLARAKTAIEHQNDTPDVVIEHGYFDDMAIATMLHGCVERWGNMRDEREGSVQYDLDRDYIVVDVTRCENDGIVYSQQLNLHEPGEFDIDVKIFLCGEPMQVAGRTIAVYGVEEC